MSLEKLKLAHRFAVLFAIIFVGFAIYGAWSFRTLDELKVNGPIYLRIVQSKDLVADILPPPCYILESYLVSLQMMRATPDELKPLIESFGKLKSDYDIRHEFWSRETLEPELKDEFLNRADKPAQEFYQIALNQFIPALEKADSVAVNAAFKTMSQLYEVHRAAIDKTVEISNKRSETDEGNAKAIIGTSMQIMLAILVLVVGIVTLLLVIISRSITRPLQEAVEVAGVVAKGDLTQRIDVVSGDEAGQLLQALKDMNDSLVGIVGEVRDTTEAITTAVKEIAAGNSELSQRTEQQAASLEETASSMEELTSTVRQNAENARHANQLAGNASDIAVKGGQVVNDVVNTMSSISTSSKKIVDIISVIEGIAFQTNILALNAAVEAARAGEQGRGFAVVAAEVRNLAQRSAAAAKEIKALIDDSVNKVEAGSKQVDQAGATMTEIVLAVKRVTDIMAEISAASDEQSAGIEQVNQAIVQMDDATQQNAALVEEAAAAAESMLEQADTLKEAVSVFKLEANLAREKTVVVKSSVAHSASTALALPRRVLQV